MVFVELTPFVAFRAKHWSDDELRALQNFLLATPDAGDLIRGGAGLCRLRWSAQGHGKRIYLIDGYVKSQREDLTPQQVKTLAELMRDIRHG